MATFDTKLATRNYETNVVLDIDGVYYSQKKVDSGISMLDANVGIVMDASVSPTTFDIRSAKTSIASLSFTLMDKDGALSTSVNTATDLWIGKEVKAYIGFINNNFGFGNYQLISTTYIKSYNKVQNSYKFKASEALDLIKKPIYTTFTDLNEELDDSETSIDLLDASSLPSSGTVIIGSEFITYTGIASNTLTGCTRGVIDSDASDHEIGDLVYKVTTLEDNAIDIMLDILQTELALDSSLINTTTFTDIRDDQLSADGDFTFYMYNIEDALKFIEDSILIATNCRLYTDDGKISLAILDQAGTPDYSIDEDSSRGMPGFKVDSNKLINKVYVKYDYNWGKGKYEKTETFTDADSITEFGESKPFTFEFNGVTTDNTGADIASNRAARILARLAYPRASIKVTTHFDRYNIRPSDIVLFTNRYLPKQGVGLGINDTLECMSRSVKGLKDDPKIDFNLEYTSFTGYRIGYMSPSETITTITSQGVVEVADATYYASEYKIRLWNISGAAYEADAVNTITGVSGSQITFENSWSTTLTTNHKLVFADYDDCSSTQQGLFAFTSPNTDEFADSTKAYQITL